MSYQNIADDLLAARILGMGAMRFAGKVVAAQEGASAATGGPEAIAALDRARQALSTESNVTVAVDALRDLQLAAALFTVQMASNDHGDLAALQPFKDKLEALPEHREAVARIMDGHDSTVATRTLAHSAIDYTRQVIIAEDNDAPIGSNGMGRALNDLQIAAFTFTVQIAISEGHDPKAMRRIEKKLVAMFTRQGAS